MYCLTDNQIEFIRNDISARGVAMVSLQHDLLDHICCMVEHDLDPDGDFEAFYAARIKTFFKHELREIEHETITLLTFKQYYIMKKIMLITGAVAVGLLSVGLFFKFNHFPGAMALIFLGVISLSLVFLPLLFILKIREKNSARDKAITGLGALGGILVSLGVLFKIMHWPGANMLGIVALGLMLLVFLPVYFFTGIRNPDTKVNTIVSSVFIFYGCALLLMLIRSGGATQQLMAMNAEGVLRSESILSEQQKLTALLLSKTPSVSEPGKEIFGLCEEIKTFLVRSDTGSSRLAANGLLSEMDANDYIVRSAEIQQKIDEANSKIEAYNQSVTGRRIERLDAIYKRKVADAINDLIQVQMIVLQNQSALALK